MKIHSLVYIVIGILVSSYAWTYNINTSSNKMIMFFYLGIGMIFYGLIMMLVFRGKKEVKTNVERPVNFAARCPRCGLQLNVFDNFCSKCGNYLKPRNQ